MQSSLLATTQHVIKNVLTRRPSIFGQPMVVVGLQSIIPSQPTLSVTENLQWNQYRCRWTKAKKKRVARYESRQELERKGIPIKKPRNYVPKDIRIVDAANQEERRKETKEQDERASEELRKKLQAAAIAREHSVLRHHMTGITMNDRVRKLFALHNGSQREVVNAQKHLGMQIFQLREGDTGSSAVQVIALTTRIQQLQTHLAKHKKDKHSKRGMDALFVRRRKLLDYLEREDFDSYRKVVKTLGLSR
jgi:small subunit ribosomal protein S15